MKFISSRDLRINPGKVWKNLENQDPLIITSNGKPIAMMCKTDEDSMEATLEEWRQVRFLKALRESREAARSSGSASLTIDEIDEEIALVRKKRESR